MKIIPLSKKAGTKIIIFSILLILIVGVVVFFAVTNLTGKEIPAIGISGYFDEAGKEIEPTILQSVIGLGDSTVEGVTFITIEVNAINKDTTPLTFEIKNPSPKAFSDKLILSSIEALPNEQAHWESDLIDITSFEGTSPTFSITIEGTSPLRQTVQKTADITFSVSENPFADFDVDISSPTIPADTYPLIETNAEGGWESYKKEGVWIKVDATGDGNLETLEFINSGSLIESIHKRMYAQDPIALTSEGYHVLGESGQARIINDFNLEMINFI